MEIFYIAYGSNLNLEEMSKRCPFSKKIGETILEGYELECNRYLNIKKNVNSRIPVGIFRIAEGDLPNLDHYEDYPHLYYKEYLDIKLNNQKIKALVYIMNEVNAHQKASQEYIDICLQGYEDFHFDKKILLRAFNNCDD